MCIAHTLRIRVYVEDWVSALVLLLFLKANENFIAQRTEHPEQWAAAQLLIQTAEQELVSGTESGPTKKLSQEC